MDGFIKLTDRIGKVVGVPWLAIYGEIGHGQIATLVRALTIDSDSTDVLLL